MEKALRRDTVELLNLTLAQQNNTLNTTNNTTTAFNTTATTLHDNTSHVNDDTASQSDANGFSNNRDASSHVNNNNNSSINEASIMAAMPEVKVPHVSARLYDDREGNITPLRDLKANCYGVC